MDKTTLLLPLLLAGLAGAVGGCGGTPEASGSGGGPDTENVADDKAELAFAKCMREKGFNISDPDGSGRIEMRLEGKPGDGGPRRVQEATKDCRKKTGGGPREPTEAEKTEMRDQALKFAKCMREHGVEMPDPDFDGGGAVVMSKKAGERGIDPQSPVFRKAEQACQDEMPRMRRGDGPSTSTSGGGAAGAGGSGEGSGPSSSAAIAVPAP